MNTSIQGPVHLKLGIFDLVPYSFAERKYKNGTILATGMVVSIVRSVFGVNGVTWEFYGPENQQMEDDYRMKNGSWTGITGRVQTKELDANVGVVLLDDKKFEDFKVLPPLFYDTLGIYASRDGGQRKQFFYFLLNVDKRIWICIFSSFILMVMVSSMADTSPHIVSARIKKGLAMYFWMYLAALFCEGSARYAVSRSSQMLLFLWLYFVIIMSNVIFSEFKAVLAVPTAEEKIHSVPELAEKENVVPMMVRNSPVYDFLNSSPVEHHQKLAKRSKDKGGLLSLTDYALLRTYQRVKDGKAVLLVAKKSNQILIQSFCTKLRGNRMLYFLDDDFNPFTVIYLLRKDFPSHLFKVFHQRMRTHTETGLYEYISRKYSRNYWKCEVENDHLELTFKLKHLLPVFYLLFQCLAVCMVTCVLEMFIHKCTNRSDNINHDDDDDDDLSD